MGRSMHYFQGSREHRPPPPPLGPHGYTSTPKIETFDSNVRNDEKRKKYQCLIVPFMPRFTVLL